MRSRLERDRTKCARDLAALFDRGYDLVQRLIAEMAGMGEVDLWSLKEGWNRVHEQLVHVAPVADAVGAEDVLPTQQRVWTLLTFKTCVPRMKAIVDLELMALKIAFGATEDAHAEFALHTFDVLPEFFAPFVLACRDAPKLKLRHDEAADLLLRAVVHRFDSDIQPMFDEAAALVLALDGA